MPIPPFAPLSDMAVCGLPEPDARHAERAADFALSLVTAAADVGRATGVRLALRVGVHSGPVLAGVLLGERARFQLFGDTGAGATQKTTVASSLPRHV